jgi:membrane protease YdiL (CAAX protease family)
MFPVFLVVMAVTAPINTAASGGPVTALVVGVGTAALALWCYVALVRWLEHRRTSELALSEAGPSLGRGALLGFGLFTATILLLAALGGYRVTGWGSFDGALIALGLMSCVAVTEELLFRGVLFRLLEEKLGTLGSIGCSGLVFGMGHVINPEITFWGALAITIEAGFMLGAAYAATRSLWLPIGLHLAWNVSLAGVYGTGGGTDVGTGSLLEGTMSGAGALFGGTSGPEASPLAVLLCSAVTVAFLVLAKRRGRLYRRGEVPLPR